VTESIFVCCDSLVGAASSLSCRQGSDSGRDSNGTIGCFLEAVLLARSTGFTVARTCRPVLATEQL